MCYLGAGSASLSGQYLHLPNNSIRTLAGCGAAAAIAVSFNTPLAALLCLLELTGNQNIIFPGMLAIVSANLAARELFKSDFIFLSQFRGIGLDYRNVPVAQSL